MTGPLGNLSGEPQIEFLYDFMPVWDEVAPMLQKALDKTGDEYRIEDVKTLLSNHEGLLWLVRTQGRIQAVFVTQIHQLPNKKIGSVRYAAGEDLHVWKDIVHVFEGYFRHANCDYFDIEGRRGWLKLYQPIGFQEQYVTIRKRLKDG